MFNVLVIVGRLIISFATLNEIKKEINVRNKNINFKKKCFSSNLIDKKVKTAVIVAKPIRTAVSHAKLLFSSGFF